MNLENIKNAASKLGKKTEESANERGRIVGVEMEPSCWSWWGESANASDTDARYLHTYSQRTGKTCRNRSRGYAKTVKLEAALA